MTSNDTIQGVSQILKRTNRSISKFLQATQNLLSIQERFSPGHILVIMIGGIALAELVAMGAVYFVRHWPFHLQALFDAAIMTAIIFPLLYLLSFKPLLLKIQQRQRSESIIRSRLRLMQYANTHTLSELLEFALNEIETLTGSRIGFFHFVEVNQKTINLQAWSTNTLQNMCKAEGKGSHYDLEAAGVWADAVRQHQAIIHNNYAALAHRKGLPEGHAQIVRELVVPILRDNKVMAVLGVGNKSQDYTAYDLEQVSTFADFAWDIVKHVQAEYAIRQSEEKFRTLVDWTYDWELWLDPRGNIVYTSPSCGRISGYTPNEFIADPSLLIRIVHPDDRQLFEDHQKVVHDSLAGPITIEYRIISRDGSDHWIEHVCRPLFGLEDQHLGRRIGNRDITDRKHAEKKILEQHQKEVELTQTIQTIQADIARDLHDTLGQNIGFLRMNLAHLSETNLGSQTDLENRIQHLTGVANESYDLIRAMLVILQSGHSPDLQSLFTRYAEQVAARSSLQIDITSEGDSNQLSLHQTRQLFYIFREALNNIEKHANADHVKGEFNWDKHALKLVISDNGRGFDADAVQTNNRYGLKFMRERAELLKGSFSAKSSIGKGTTITVVVPYEYETSTRSQ